jgi:DNA-binding CsgD family transcriptional regulator
VLAARTGRFAQRNSALEAFLPEEIMAAARAPSGTKGSHAAQASERPPPAEQARPSGIQRAAMRTLPRGSRAGTEAGKWTTLDQFVHSGFFYQLRRRPVDSPGDNARLTQREELVVAAAFTGESNKSIAFRLGVAPSTVGVLLFRACTKLGARSRSELLAAYARRTQGPDDDD